MFFLETYPTTDMVFVSICIDHAATCKVYHVNIIKAMNSRYCTNHYNYANNSFIVLWLAC